MENMKYNCNIIKDLLPSYIDELTSDDTNSLVENHIIECEECRNLYNMMKEPKKNEVEAKREAVEINFLKKNHRRTKLIVTVVTIIAVLLTLIGIRMSPYIETRQLAYDQYDIEFTVGDITIEDNYVEDGIVQMTLIPKNNYVIKDVIFEENDGIVTFNIYGKRRFFKNYEYCTAFHMENTIKQIKTDDIILWDNGVYISDGTINIYKTKHLYVGDLMRNGNTLRALNVSDTLGEFKIELQTTTEPYGMILKLQKQVQENQRDYFESCMKYYAYASMAVIDNLSYVTFSYNINGVMVESTWSVEDAKKELGKNIKDYGTSESNLELLKMDLNIIR